mmetsp:Transcript_21115/g.54449  ORF Transcript_21115/g.54449 Transcript_21115/m.54449 type:complete len:250 (+) Transcript_21115:369-1118(+)
MPMKCRMSARYSSSRSTRNSLTPKHALELTRRPERQPAHSISSCTWGTCVASSCACGPRPSELVGSPPFAPRHTQNAPARFLSETNGHTFLTSTVSRSPSARTRSASGDAPIGGSGRARAHARRAPCNCDTSSMLRPASARHSSCSSDSASDLRVDASCAEPHAQRTAEMEQPEPSPGRRRRARPLSPQQSASPSPMRCCRVRAIALLKASTTSSLSVASDASSAAASGPDAVVAAGASSRRSSYAYSA